MPLERKCVVEVLVLRPDESWSLGTGYLVSTDRIITALHVVKGISSEEDFQKVMVRFLDGDRTLLEADLLWQDAVADMALLGLSSRPETPMPLDPMSWGTFKRRTRVKCDGVGFPKAMCEQVDTEVPLRESTGIFGYIDPYGGIKGGWVPWNVDQIPIDPDLWGGISGGPAFADGCFIGVIVSVPSAFGGYKLHISPVDTVIKHDADFRRHLSLSSLVLIDVGEFELGAAIAFDNQQRKNFPKPVSALLDADTFRASSRDWYPVELDIVDWPIRDQGQRATTVPFAVVACREYMEIRAGKASKEFDLSEECLYWATKTATADPIPAHIGTRLAYCLDALETIGVCEEAEWPYNAVEQPNYSAGVSENIREQAAHYRHKALHYQVGGTAVDVYSLLVFFSRPVVITIPAFKSWYDNKWVRYTGDIMLPLPGEGRLGGTAFCVVGFEPSRASFLGGGKFRIRNSWGGRWGWQSGRPGYGRIPASFLDEYLVELCVL